MPWKKSKKRERAMAMDEQPRLKRIKAKEMTRAGMAARENMARLQELREKLQRFQVHRSINDAIHGYGEEAMWVDEDRLMDEYNPSEEDSWDDASASTQGELMLSNGFSVLPYCYEEKHRPLIHKCISDTVGSLGLTPAQKAVCIGILCAAASNLKQVTFKQLASHLDDPEGAVAGTTADEKAASIALIADELCRKLRDVRFDAPQNHRISLLGHDPLANSGNAVFSHIQCRSAQPPEDGVIDLKISTEARFFVVRMSDDLFNTPL